LPQGRPDTDRRPLRPPGHPKPCRQRDRRNQQLPVPDPLVAPRARRIPISDRRSSTAMTMSLASRRRRPAATAPSPMNTAVPAAGTVPSPSAAFIAVETRATRSLEYREETCRRPTSCDRTDRGSRPVGASPTAADAPRSWIQAIRRPRSHVGARPPGRPRRARSVCSSHRSDRGSAPPGCSG
jgi:hypothetical protein